MGLSAKQAYTNLKKRHAESAHLQGSASILMSDRTLSMPKGSAAERSQMVGVISAVNHRSMTDPVLGDWLEKAESEISKLAPIDQRNLELMRKSWVLSTAMPSDLVERGSKIRSEGRPLHAQQKTDRTGNWKDVEGWFKEAFDYARETGAVKKEVLGMPSIYDALLDGFSPGVSAKIVEAQFAKLDAALPDLIRATMERQKSQGGALPLDGSFHKSKQMRFNNWGVRAVGFDYERGRLDAITGHPSCGGSTGDKRITTFLDRGDFTKSFKACVHEAGHGMYYQGLDPDWAYQPVGGCQGMDIHESQSMIIEYQACMTPEFITLAALKAREVFGDAPSLQTGNLHKHMLNVQPSLIRVYADELTYPMHISLRAELERAVVEGELEVSDLPDAWNEGMQKRFGVQPENHIDGLMQDVHWYVGSMGYFPSYALGAMGAAQLFNAATAANPDIRPQIGQGNFKPLLDWLRPNIHARGCIVDASQLMKDATGETLNADHHVEHLKRRYLEEPGL